MSRILSILLVLVTVLSCDVASMDNIGQPNRTDENLTNNFYTTFDSNLTIDPTAFTQLKSANSLVVSQLPKNGEARFIENGYVFYRSNNSQALSDAFVIGGKTTSGTLISEEVKINFVKNSADLPCFAGTLGDKVTTEAEQAKEIDVLANDKTCSMVESNSLSIEIYPKNGKAVVLNQKVVYTPNKDFVGEDLFFYRVGINTLKNPVAPVEVSVSESAECINGMTDDIVNVLSYTPNTELTINVLQNDKICLKYQNAELRILKNPSVGTLRIDKNNSNNMVIYYKSETAPKGSQIFEYALYRSEKTYIKAQVILNFN
jgi:hypothetical protein